MENRPASVSPKPDEENRMKTEVVSTYEDVMDLKKDRSPPRYMDTEERQCHMDPRLSLLNSNNVYYRRESEDDKSELIEYDKIKVECDKDCESEEEVADKVKDRSSTPTQRTNYDSDDIKMETLDIPLDLSVKSEIRDDYLERRGTPPPSPICRDSCTDSDDSDGGKANGGKAYKKSLMKRYRKLFTYVFNAYSAFMMM